MKNIEPKKWHYTRFLTVNAPSFKENADGTVTKYSRFLRSAYFKVQGSYGSRSFVILSPDEYNATEFEQPVVHGLQQLRQIFGYIDLSNYTQIDKGFDPVSAKELYDLLKAKRSARTQSLMSVVLECVAERYADTSLVDSLNTKTVTVPDLLFALLTGWSLKCEKANMLAATVLELDDASLDQYAYVRLIQSINSL